MNDWVINFFLTSPLTWKIAFYFFLIAAGGVFVFAPRNPLQEGIQTSGNISSTQSVVTSINSPNSQQQFIDKYYATPPNQGPTFELARGTSPDKSYLNKTPPELWADISKLNPVQLDRFVEREYVGKWIAFKSQIVSLYSSDDLGSIDFGDNSFKVRVIMAQDQIEKLKELYRGRSITVEGRFFRIMDELVSFDEGILTDR